MTDTYFKLKHDDLFQPTLKAMVKLGGSASNPEIEEMVADILNLSEVEINEKHRGNTTKFSYRMAWSKNYLKRFGLLENSSRGVWALKKDLSEDKINELDPEEIKKTVRQFDTIKQSVVKDGIESEITNEEDLWKDELLNTIKRIEPEQFERLCQRLLRELGFINVQITGKTNDHGIDGKGIFKIREIISYHVVFQAKRYKDTVSSNVIRDFRGAMEGRADKGLLLTTGIFSREAKKEALRESATIPIDLIDGQSFVSHLKNLKLGVKTKERITIDTDWFNAI